MRPRSRELTEHEIRLGMVVFFFLIALAGGVTVLIEDLDIHAIVIPEIFPLTDVLAGSLESGPREERHTEEWGILKTRPIVLSGRHVPPNAIGVADLGRYFPIIA